MRSSPAKPSMFCDHVILKLEIICISDSYISKKFVTSYMYTCEIHLAASKVIFLNHRVHTLQTYACRSTYSFIETNLWTQVYFFPLSLNSIWKRLNLLKKLHKYFYEVREFEHSDVKCRLVFRTIQTTKLKF